MCTSVFLACTPGRMELLLIKIGKLWEALDFVVEIK